MMKSKNTRELFLVALLVVSLFINLPHARAAVPINDGGQFTNLDNTDNIYAQRKDYIFTSNVSDADGFGDLVTVDLTIQTGGAVERVTFRYAEDTNTFSELSGDTTKWTLNTSSCTATRAGNDCDLTFYFMAEWNATEEVDLDVKLVTIDSLAQNDTDTYNTNADVITDLLTYDSINFECNTPFDTVTVGGTCTVNYLLGYARSPGATTCNPGMYPPASEFNSVSIRHSNGTIVGTDSTVNPAGDYMTITVASTVGSHDYHLYVDMADASYTDGPEYNVNETIISERVTVTSFTASDLSVPVNTIVELRAIADLEYWTGNVLTASDILEIEGVNFTYNTAHSRWEASVTSATPTTTTYDTVTNTNEGSYGITSGDMDGNSVSVTWYTSGSPGGSGSGGGSDIPSPPVIPPVIPPMIIPSNWWQERGSVLIAALVIGVVVYNQVKESSPSQKTREDYSRLLPDGKVDLTFPTAEGVEDSLKKFAKKLKEDVWD